MEPNVPLGRLAVGIGARQASFLLWRDQHGAPMKEPEPVEGRTRGAIRRSRPTSVLLPTPSGPKMTRKSPMGLNGTGRSNAGRRPRSRGLGFRGSFLSVVNHSRFLSSPRRPLRDPLAQASTTRSFHLSPKSSPLFSAPEVPLAHLLAPSSAPLDAGSSFLSGSSLPEGKRTRRLEGLPKSP